MEAIGIFDSGVGGLTVFRAIRERLPGEPIHYLGDTARVPYGTRSPETVVRYALNNARFLAELAPLKLLVVACNTASAVALPALSEALDLPVIGVVEPGARAAARATRSGRIAVIGTRGTIQSGAYQEALRALDSGFEVVARACPLLVPLAEEGWEAEPIARQVVERYIGDLPRLGIDTLVLGCTHYPILSDAIRSVVGPDVTLVDSASATAEAVAALVRGTESVASTAPSHRMYVTDGAEAFLEIAARFLGEMPPLEQVDVGG